jgi:hypothetical protein
MGTIEVKIVIVAKRKMEATSQDTKNLPLQDTEKSTRKNRKLVDEEQFNSFLKEVCKLSSLSELEKKIIYDIGQRYLYHKKSGDAVISTYQWANRIVAIVIPLLNAVLTFRLATHDSVEVDIISISILISFISTIASSFSITENTQQVIQHLIELNDWKIKFFTNISEICSVSTSEVDSKKLYSLLQEYNSELSIMGSGMGKIYVSTTNKNREDLKLTQNYRITHPSDHLSE